MLWLGKVRLGKVRSLVPNRVMGRYLRLGLAMLGMQWLGQVMLGKVRLCRHLLGQVSLCGYWLGMG